MSTFSFYINFYAIQNIDCLYYRTYVMMDIAHLDIYIGPATWLIDGDSYRCYHSE